jgi:hypothetical protein
VELGADAPSSRLIASRLRRGGAPGSFPVLAGGIPAILPSAHNGEQARLLEHQPVVPLCRLLLRLKGLCTVHLPPGEPDASSMHPAGFGSKTLLSVGNTRNLTPDIEILTCRRARSGIRASTSICEAYIGAVDQLLALETAVDKH